MHDAVSCIAEQDEEAVANAVKEFCRRLGLCGSHYEACQSLYQAAAQREGYSHNIHLAQNLVHLLQRLQTDENLTIRVHLDTRVSDSLFLIFTLKARTHTASCS